LLHKVQWYVLRVLSNYFTYYEAVELRDGDKSAYLGNGTLKAVGNVKNVLGPAILKEKFDVGHDLEKIDELMRKLDGTDDKSKLGANAILGISMACARPGAAERVSNLCSGSGVHHSRTLSLTFNRACYFMNFSKPNSLPRTHLASPCLSSTS
jgi:hypothetical protein